MKFVAVAALAAGAAVANAGSVDLAFTGVQNGQSVSVGGSNYTAGHMKHNVYSGGMVTGTFNSFCIELGEFANNGVSTYEIVDLELAPDPDLGGMDPHYSAAQEAAVINVLALAVDANWIGLDLQLDSGTPQQLAAIQAMIWESLGLGTSSASDDVMVAGTISHSIDYLRNGVGSGSASNFFALNLRAAVAQGEQDMLYVVPLPTAAWAGIGMLGLCAGVRSYRRRG